MCLRWSLSANSAFPACVCILKFPWAYACACTINTYVCVFLCVSHSPPSSCSCVSACSSQQHCNQTITAQGNSALFKRLLFPPYTKNNNYSTILVNHKPPCRLRDQKGEAFQRDARTGPPQGRITDRTVPLCLSGLIGHMLEWSWLAIL